MPARPRSLEVIRAAARRWFAAQDIDRDQLNDMLVALGEASANAVEHAYGSREGTVEVNLDRIGDEIVMTISDVGHWREARGTNRGRGITVIERFSDAMSIDRADTGTTVTIRCAVNGSPQP